MAKVNKDLLQEILLLLNIISNKIDALEKSFNIETQIQIIKAIRHEELICAENTRKVSDAIKELKGLVAIVRPEVIKSGWYGEEIKTTNLLE